MKYDPSSLGLIHLFLKIKIYFLESIEIEKKNSIKSKVKFTHFFDIRSINDAINALVVYLRIRIKE